jgi:hypothetical protein
MKMLQNVAKGNAVLCTRRSSVADQSTAIVTLQCTQSVQYTQLHIAAVVLYTLH